MKTKNIFITKNERILRGFFNLYMRLVGIGYNGEVKNRVYDNNDMIDTLGNDYQVTKFTHSYSCELYSTYSIKLPFGWSLQYVNCEDKELYLTNEKVNIYE